MDSLIDTTAGNFWIVTFKVADKAVVWKGSLSDGSVTLMNTLEDMSEASNRVFDMKFYKKEKLLIPVVDETAKIAYLYLLDRASLAIEKTVTLSFPSGYTTI